jgi:MFS superfamily sulfate permease-like transporter
MFGFSVDADGFIPELRGFVDGLVAGETVGAALAVGIGALIVILVLQRAMPKVPAVLVAVVLSILAVQVFNLGASGVSVVGTLPSGFPPFTIPHVSLSDLPLLLGGALGIVFVALADTISTASAFASRAGGPVNGNLEMVGIGTSNIAAGLFQGFPVSTSGSRTAVAEQAGAKT